MVNWCKAAAGVALCSVLALVASCGGGGSGGGSGGGGSSSSSASSSSSSSAVVTSYSAGSEITVARAFDYETVAVTGLANGNYVVVWNGFDIEGETAERSGIFYRIYTPAGSPVTPVRVANTLTANDQRLPSVGALSGGGFVIAWNHARAIGDAATGDTIHMQRFDNAGDKQGSQTQIITNLEGSTRSQVTGLSGGGYVITWEDSVPNDHMSSVVPRYRVQARVYSASGTDLNTWPTPAYLDEISSDTLAYARGVLIPRTDGGFVYVNPRRGSRPGAAGSSSHVYARVYSSSLAVVDSDRTVNDGDQGGREPTGVPLSGGGYVASWIGNTDNRIFYRRMQESNTPYPTQTGFALDTPGLYGRKLAPLTSGGFVSVSNTTNTVDAQVFNPDITPFIGVQTVVSGVGPRGVAVGSATGGSFAVSWFLDFESPKTLKLRIYSPV
jgi:hypothetical protein